MLHALLGSVSSAINNSQYSAQPHWDSVDAVLTWRLSHSVRQSLPMLGLEDEWCASFWTVSPKQKACSLAVRVAPCRAAHTSAFRGCSPPGPLPWRTTRTLPRPPSWCRCGGAPSPGDGSSGWALGFLEFWSPFSISPCSSAIPHVLGFTNNHFTFFCDQHCKLPSLWWFVLFPFFCYACCIKIRSDMFLQPFHSYLMARNWFSAFVLLLALNILELWYYSLGLYPCWFF